VEVSIQAVSPLLMGESSAKAGPAQANRATAAPRRDDLKIRWFIELLLADRFVDMPGTRSRGLNSRRLVDGERMVSFMRACLRGFPVK